MIDEVAQARLDAFFEEISDMAPFMNCQNAGVHTRGFQGETPLKIAVVRQDLQLVKDLLDAGANPNLPGEDDRTPLHHAAERESVEIVQLLLERGASVTLKDIYGHAPVDCATKLNRDLLRSKPST